MTTLRRRGTTVALSLGLAVTIVPAATVTSAAAEPDSGRVELSVVGSPEATTVFGDVTVVPGYTQTRSVEVVNVGDLPGTLTVEVVDATSTGAPSVFVDHLTINGVSAADLDGVATAIAPIRTLAAGEVVTVPVTLAFDVDDERPDPGSTFTFAVRATLTGETPGTPTPTPAPTATSTAAPGPGTDSASGGRGTTAARTETGGLLAINRTNLLWAAGALLGGGLVVLVPVLRRRRGKHVA